MDCVFCKIAAKEIPATLVLDTDELVAFPDLHPKAAVHVLIVPKRHIASVQHAQPEDRALLGALLLAAREVAAAQGVADGYRLVVNVGKKAGQTIDHLHVHLMAGKDLRSVTA